MSEGVGGVRVRGALSPAAQALQEQTKTRPGSPVLGLETRTRTRMSAGLTSSSGPLVPRRAALPGSGLPPSVSQNICRSGGGMTPALTKAFKDGPGIHSCPSSAGMDSEGTATCCSELKSQMKSVDDDDLQKLWPLLSSLPPQPSCLPLDVFSLSQDQVVLLPYASPLPFLLSASEDAARSQQDACVFPGGLDMFERNCQEARLLYGRGPSHKHGPGRDKAAGLLPCCCPTSTWIQGLCGIFSHTFNLSLRLGRVPQLWKTSCIVPVPKTSHPKELNSYRPVALTSHLMKTLERLILDHLCPLVSSFMDPLQFAYQPSIGVDDAVIYLLHTSLTHLEKAGSTVRIMFFDFSSAFNTIQPRLLGDKLEVAGVDHHLTTWILDYLTQRPQFVRVKGSESDRLLCSTGVPQGTVLAPFLFTLYTADFSYSTSSCHLQKFSDDSAAVGLITDGDDTEYRELIQGFVDWSLRNNLQINAGKTKELVVDIRRRNNPPPAPVNILGTDVDVVESYKYLGVHLNNNLDWTHNTDALVKKGQHTDVHRATLECNQLFLDRTLLECRDLLRTMIVVDQPSSTG
ncbi:RNA-directed DNA polymerase from mobile element jockey [Takifugu flavidus]|uniref:RNA-directed DNA polymerase from mobile element jockey n=1 Tax=Takifugu flavidus TaxID=433684 RepID=A0A5C6PMN6_9TELE|nr:RNA-directed DNA polymerase from mobile element jockey [Takifugu flavidus]